MISRTQYWKVATRGENKVASSEDICLILEPNIGSWFAYNQYISSVIIQLKNPLLDNFNEAGLAKQSYIGRAALLFVLS